MNARGFYSHCSASFNNKIVVDAVNTRPSPLASLVSIPIDSHLHGGSEISAAEAVVKIQAAFRGYLSRSIVSRIGAIAGEAAQIEAQIQRQDTVDAVRRDAHERLRFSESLMSLLLRLDAATPAGIVAGVRDLRRRVSRRVVALQEIFDAVIGAPTADSAGFPPGWEEFWAEIAAKGT